VTFPFRSPSIAALVEAIDAAFTKSDIGTMLLKADADGCDPDRADNKAHRLQLVFKKLRAADDEASTRAALEIARLTMFRMANTTIGGESRYPEFGPLRDALAADGWEYDKDSARLTAIVPQVSAPEELNGLEAELEERGWDTAALHFRRAADGFGAGDWESANSQLRSFLEDFLPLLAEVVRGKRPSNAGAAIQSLDSGFLLDGEREFLKALWALCNERGSHPGASSQAEATLRLMAVTAEARFLLKRLTG